MPTVRTEEAEAVRLIRRAFDLGYTFFDTAEVYGTAADPHVNETLVGKALADVKNHTVIATKFGLRFDQESGKVPLPLVADSRPENHPQICGRIFETARNRSH